MNLVCISGKRRSGKSALGNILAKNYGWKPVSLAGPLKRMCMEHFDLSFSQVEGQLKEQLDPRYDRTPRDIMIRMGQFYRSIDPYFWIHKTLEIVKGYPDTVCVVTDMRFKNELQAFKDAGAVLVRLERSEHLTGKNIDDPSETELDNYVNWALHVPAEQNDDMADLEVTAERVYEAVHSRQTLA